MVRVVTSRGYVMFFFFFLIKEHLLRLVLHDTRLGLYDKSIIPLHIIQSHCLAFEIHLLPFLSFVQCVLAIATCFNFLQDTTLLTDHRLFPSCWILLLPFKTHARHSCLWEVFSDNLTQHSASLMHGTFTYKKAVLSPAISRSWSQDLVILCFHGSLPYTILTLLNICIPSAHQSGLQRVGEKSAVAKCTALECLWCVVRWSLRLHFYAFNYISFLLWVFFFCVCVEGKQEIRRSKISHFSN